MDSKGVGAPIPRARAAERGEKDCLSGENLISSVNGVPLSNQRESGHSILSKNWTGASSTDI